MIYTFKEFEKWVKVQMIRQEYTQRTLADKMGISYPRISEAIHGKSSGIPYIPAIIEVLGGNLDDFRVFLQEQKIIES